MIKTRDNGIQWHGTDSERLLNFSPPYQEGMMFHETNTNKNYMIWGQQWVLYSLAGSFMVWKNKWLQDTYYENDVVRDETWTMIANKTTTDRPSPQPYGDQTFILSDTPTWATQSITDVVRTGLRISNLTKAYDVSSIRVWLPSVSASVNYRVIMEDNITGLIKFGQSFTGDILGSPGWLTATIDRVWLVPSDDITIWLTMENIASTTTFNHPWDYIGESNQDNNPGNGNIETRGQQNTVRINVIDDDAVDQTSDLSQVITGTILRIANESDLTRYYEYEVIDVTDNTTWFLFDVRLIEEGVGGEPLEVVSTVTFDVPIPASVDYVEIVNNYSGNTSLNGELKIGTNAQVTNQNAYGVDILLQEYIVSPDWDLVAYSG